MTVARTRNNFPSLWRCVYWFPSNKFVGDEPSEYQMKSYLDGNTLVLESNPNKEGSYMLVRLELDEATGVATGNWHETTSPTGEFKAAQYSGAGQLIVDPKTHAMEGKWAGAGFSRKLNRMQVYSGNWEITPIQEA